MNMSSQNLTKLPDKETGTQNRPQRLSYAKATRRPSLIRDSLKTPTGRKSATHSNVWKVGGSPASCPSLFFDFTSRPEHRAEILRHINSKFPNNCGVRLHSDHARRIVELFIADKKDYSKIKFMGISFPDNQCILPSIPLSPDARLVHLQLSDLPFTTRDTLSNGIQEALSDYGNVLDYGILRDYDSHLFMGKGYATLEINNAKSGTTPLRHTVPWPNSDDLFHVTWAEMPLHCLHCHQAGHATSACPNRATRSRVCWSCGQTGHRAAKCLNRKPKPDSSSPTTPPMPHSPSSQSANSQTSDISMLKLDLSSIESHNDNIINEYTPDNFDDNMPLPTPQFTSGLLRHIHDTYPMSDQAKQITAFLTPSALDLLAESLKQNGQPFASSTPSSHFSGSPSPPRDYSPT
ncbi:hypothetical protein O0I10_010882 [Lichtheimia ornata]|uniref:CCHC-type domain-containing protein n=2 Tax=Lichtheimia ornata TaxID=688661 RepID=A0AAD7UUQ9_9FUNG|nr:uncharacterized protein O0I10_010882 [Lichtheimia ornata]KAJ8653446.1 hypothetical protein O0I10_010882 [Lichtheimia ornata]